MFNKHILILFLFPVISQAQLTFQGTESGPEIVTASEQLEQEIQRALWLAAEEIKNRPSHFPKVYPEKPELPARTAVPELPTNVLPPPVGGSPVFDAEFERKKAEYEAEMATVLRERIEYLKIEREKGKESEFGGTFSELEKTQEGQIETLRAKKREIKDLIKRKTGK